MTLHADVTATGRPVHFAHPHSPWERPSNDNANRIIREFFPKGTDITTGPVYLAGWWWQIQDPNPGSSRDGFTVCARHASWSGHSVKAR
jgi:hypothetical protein